MLGGSCNGFTYVSFRILYIAVTGSSIVTAITEFVVCNGYRFAFCSGFSSDFCNGYYRIRVL